MYSSRPLRVIKTAHLAMAMVTTSDVVMTAAKKNAPPFSLIEPKSLPSRLVEELARTWREFARDPRGFLRNLSTDDTKDAKRRRRLYFGLAGALLVHAALLTFIIVIGLRSLAASKEVPTVIMVPGLEASVGPVAPAGDVAHSKNDSASSGGGAPESAPATRGAVPKALPTPPIVKPFAPSVPMPSLPVTPTVVGPESPAPPPNATLGIPNGAVAEAPAPGVGPGIGIGGHNGPGAGNGDGAGTNPGSGPGKGTKDGNGGVPNGGNLVNGPISYNRLSDHPGSRGISWIRRPFPIITPEAQQNKVIGEVWLRATFNADGTITDIEVLHELPYGMTDSAIDALKRSRFQPATLNGQPVTLTNVPVRINVKTEGK